MSKWYQGKDGWEEGNEYIDPGYDGSFTAYRRQVMNGGVIYEGEFWDAVTGEKVPAFLDVIVDWDGHWVHAEVIPIE